MKQISSLEIHKNSQKESEYNFIDIFELKLFKFIKKKKNNVNEFDF